MAKHLVIVESPTKAKTLRKFLGKDFIVESSVGHIRDLPASAADIPEEVKKEPWSRLGVNVEADFEPLYVISGDKKKVIQSLKAHLKNVDEPVRVYRPVLGIAEESLLLSAGQLQSSASRLATLRGVAGGGALGLSRPGTGQRPRS